MNYRHIFHAGNTCDVVKHAVLSLLIKKLGEKDKPFLLLDTHAGIGLYDLTEPRAQKTGEAQSGVLRFLASPPVPELHAYYQVLASFNPDWRQDEPHTLTQFRFYPGSPLLAARLLRPQDRIVACELHLEDVDVLRRAAHGFNNLHVHHRDGFESIRALLPPAERRGAVLIDPPFENPDEFERISSTLKELHQRWVQGTAIVWYPIKDRPTLWRFHEQLAASSIRGLFCAEFIYEEETRHDRLNGCGFILLNPPWKLDQEIESLFPKLHKALGSAYNGVNTTWLTAAAD